MSIHDSKRIGRLRLRHLQEVTEARGEEMEQQADRFHRLASEDSAPVAVSAHQLFQTPESIADLLASMIPGNVGSILEPSSGLGRIYRAIRKRFDCVPVSLVEIAPQCAEQLYRDTERDENARLFQGDFLAMSTDRLGTFDAIVMNPPFTMRSDVRHIEHARQFLNPGGTLVSVCMAGEIRKRQFEKTGTYEPLPSGSFSKEGTRVETAIVTIKN